ncbi:MAG TPA: molybdopterin-dependent oxidoreductase [Steroidobacteraceae bacterium]|jgi:DMSO/TMAO reductase YedYZ molybdopterin-dependent catalytic subunit|nr:molybdopterin-dependent oxidoreductase [Steroidobacteraceae bacterium]
MSSPVLPPGQHERIDLPRFGLTPFATRFPSELNRIEVRIRGDVDREVVLTPDFIQANRVALRADFHCVTTWSVRGLNWSGVRFADFFRKWVVPKASPQGDISFVVLRGQDGYHSSLPLQDLLADDVMLADRLNDAPLGLEHGAPLRLVAPAHYGYKSVKHIRAIEFWGATHRYRPVGFAFMAHPRARVMLEERGRWPARLLRLLYRPLVGPTARRFEKALRSRVAQK